MSFGLYVWFQLLLFLSGDSGHRLNCYATDMGDGVCNVQL